MSPKIMEARQTTLANNSGRILPEKGGSWSKKSPGLSRMVFTVFRNEGTAP